MDIDIQDYLGFLFCVQYSHQTEPPVPLGIHFLEDLFSVLTQTKLYCIVRCMWAITKHRGSLKH